MRARKPLCATHRHQAKRETHRKESEGRRNHKVQKGRLQSSLQRAWERGGQEAPRANRHDQNATTAPVEQRGSDVRRVVARPAKGHQTYEGQEASHATRHCHRNNQLACHKTSTVQECALPNEWARGGQESPAQHRHDREENERSVEGEVVLVEACSVSARRLRQTSNRRRACRSAGDNAGTPRRRT